MSRDRKIWPSRAETWLLPRQRKIWPSRAQTWLLPRDRKMWPSRTREQDVSRLRSSAFAIFSVSRKYRLKVEHKPQPNEVIVKHSIVASKKRKHK